MKKIMVLASLPAAGLAFASPAFAAAAAGGAASSGALLSTTSPSGMSPTNSWALNAAEGCVSDVAFIPVSGDSLANTVGSCVNGVVEGARTHQLQNGAVAAAGKQAGAAGDQTAAVGGK